MIQARAADARGVLDALALGWLISVGMLICWSVLPMAWGWHPSVVLTGSMSPALSPGDVVLVDPSSRVIRPGTVVAVKDASVSSGQVVHRVSAIEPTGQVVTKGDANLTQDSTPRERSDVVGMGRLVVPGVGRAALLRTGGGAPTDWIWVAATLVAAAWLVRPMRPVEVTSSRRPSPRVVRSAQAREGSRIPSPNR